MLELSCRLADDDRNDIRIEAALVKLYASELAWLVADELLQVRGGRGYETAESLAARGERAVPAEQILRDLRINRIFEGSTEIMHLLIAREAVDAHLGVAGDIIDPDATLRRKARAGARAGAFYARWLPGLAVGTGQNPAGYAGYGPLAKHLRYVERASRRLARSTFYGMSRWQGRMERRQAFLGRIVDIGAELFAMSAVCVRAHAEREQRPAGMELADLLCRHSRHRAEVLFRALWDNTDDVDAAATERILAGRYAFLEDGIVLPRDDGPWVAAGPTGAQSGTDARRRIPPVPPSNPA